MRKLYNEYETPIVSIVSFPSDDMIRTSGGAFVGEDDTFTFGETVSIFE